MWGAIAGDIIGSVYEFDNLKAKKGWPLFCPSSRYTDDTVCTVAVADFVLDRRSPATVMREWCSRYSETGFGGMFYSWVMNPDAAPYGSWGNGAAMRISPVALVARTDEEAHSLARQVTEITHNHEEAIAGACAVVDAIRAFRAGAAVSQVSEQITRDYGYDLATTVDRIRPTHKFNMHCADTVTVALVCALEASDFEDSMRNAVSIGGDSDTIACVAGAIAEARFGGVPPFILDEVETRIPPAMSCVIKRIYNHALRPE